MTPPLKDLLVEKEWIDKAGNSLPSKPESVQVRLYWKGNGETENQWKVVSSVDPVTLNEDNSWRWSFENLPANLEYLGQVYEDVNYTVFEINSGGQKINAEEYLTADVNGKSNTYQVTYERSSVPADGTNDDQISVTVTNQLVDAELTIHKIDEDTQANLSGVAFSLSIKEGAAYSLIEEGITDPNGVLKFEELAPGDYLLTETEAAAGYLLPSDSWTFTVNQQGEIVFDATDNASYGKDVMTITNQAGAELPETGGPGLIMMERFGWALLILAMLGAEIQLFGNKRRKEQ